MCFTKVPWSLRLPLYLLLVQMKAQNREIVLAQSCLFSSPSASEELLLSFCILYTDLPWHSGWLRRSLLVPKPHGIFEYISGL